MRVALFLTAELEPALALARRVRAEHAEAALVCFVRDEHREAVAAALPGVELRRDKPAGGKAAFVRALRRERFDLLVVAWHGGARFQPLRLVALVCGASRVVAVDERGKQMPVRWLAPQTWGGHAVRRLSATKAITALRLLAFAYRWTVGAAVAMVLLAPTLVRTGFGRRLGRTP
ncbi:MAG: hypothetical protein AB7O97_17055 [Planctomycetota bacterium]